jgi:ABC-type bacteriocin/lantibiotic exporter with double-glycine peptidase domain
VRADGARSSHASALRLALLGCLLSSGCYRGSARSVTAADLAADDSWERVEGIRVVRQATREDCGAAALAMVLGYWGSPVTRDDVRAAAPPAPERGIKADALRDFARGQGLRAFLIQGRLADLDHELRRHRPILVGVTKRYGSRAYAHYEVVVGISEKEQRILTIDPADGLRVDSREGFAAEWAASGHVTLIVLPAVSIIVSPSN